jgi:hypothetical protein
MSPKSHPTTTQKTVQILPELKNLSTGIRKTCDIPSDTQFGIPPPVPISMDVKSILKFVSDLVGFPVWDRPSCPLC